MQENKMGVMPVKRLIVSMSLPMMVSMLVQALYNIVDSIFVAKLSESALTAITLAFPMQNLMISVAVGTGVGINALLSKSLGEKRTDRANEAANTGILLAVISAVCFMIIGFLGAKAFIHSQTSNPEIIRYGEEYLSIVCCLSLGMFCEVIFERLLQSTGQTFFSMISQLTGAVINIILDPIMIFGLLGCPRMQVAGAAYATVIGQSVAAIVGITLNIRFNKEIHLNIKKVIRPKAEIVGRIYFVGVPSILMMSIGSLMTYLMNLILIAFSETAAAVFGVYFKLQSFFFMPVFGMNNGIIPILAYNYGAGKKKRIDEALRFGLELAVAIMIVGTTIFELFPTVLLKMFNASGDMMSMGKVALRTIAIHFPIAAIGISLGTVFQAFSKSYYSLIISLCRQLIVLIPVAWILARVTNNVNMVWWCFIIAELISCTLSIIFFKKVYKDVIEPLKETN